MNRKEKEQQVDSLAEQFGSAIVALCADYRGLTDQDMCTLRRDLRAKGATGRVVKNTLAKISVEKALNSGDEGSSKEDVQKFIGMFQGPSLVVFSETDPSAPAKVLSDFAKGKEALEIKGGWFEGEFLDQGAVKELASMPSKEELYARLLSVLQGPATKVARLLQAPGSQLVQLLEAYRSKLESDS